MTEKCYAGLAQSEPLRPPGIATLVIAGLRPALASGWLPGTYEYFGNGAEGKPEPSASMSRAPANR